MRYYLSDGVVLKYNNGGYFKGVVKNPSLRILRVIRRHRRRMLILGWLR